MIYLSSRFPRSMTRLINIPRDSLYFLFALQTAYSCYPGGSVVDAGCYGCGGGYGYGGYGGFGGCGGYGGGLYGGGVYGGGVVGGGVVGGAYSGRVGLSCTPYTTCTTRTCARPVTICRQAWQTYPCTSCTTGLSCTPTCSC